MADKTFYFPEDGYVGSSRTAIVDNASGKTSKIKYILLHNTSATVDITVGIHLTKASSGNIQSTLSGANRIGNFTIPANKTLPVPFEFPLILTAQHDALQMIATTASLVTVTVTGVEV